MRSFILPALIAVLLFPVSATEAEWRALFNGRDLAGWSGDPRLWRVENGVLTGETDDATRKDTDPAKRSPKGLIALPLDHRFHPLTSETNHFI